MSLTCHFPNPHLQMLLIVIKVHIRSEIASCIMLVSMTTELQMQHETMEAYDIVIHLKALFEKHARCERFEISKFLFSTKMQVGTSPVQHALKMNTYIERLG